MKTSKSRTLQKLLDLWQIYLERRKIRVWGFLDTFKFLDWLSVLHLITSNKGLTRIFRNPYYIFSQHRPVFGSIHLPPHLTLNYFPVPAEDMLPHSMMLPPLCFSSGVYVQRYFSAIHFSNVWAKVVFQHALYVISCTECGRVLQLSVGDPRLHHTTAFGQQIKRVF